MIPLYEEGRQKGLINQAFLQTGKPKGTYRLGDKHPKIKDCYYLRWDGSVERNNRENWGTLKQVEQKKSYQRKRHVKRWNIIKGRPTMSERSNQTNLNIKYKRGDKHPFKNGLVFFGYRNTNKRYELWTTVSKLAEHRVKRRSYPSKQPKPSTEAERKKNRERASRRLKEDLQYKLSGLLRSRIKGALRCLDISKACKSMELLGCTIAHLRDHLEAQFTAGMTWGNMGKGGWHIDHIIPCAFFDLTKPSHQKVCFNYQNLQPMWASENCSKQDKIHWSIVLTLMINNYKTIGLN